MWWSVVSMLVFIVIGVNLIPLERYLIMVDNVLASRLKTPQKKFANDILPDVHFYNVNVYNFIQVLKNFESNNLTQIAVNVYERGLPQFVACKKCFDYEEIQRVFEWELYKVYHLNCSIRETKKLWEELQFRYGQFKLLVDQAGSKFTSADYLDSLDFLICGQITQPSAEDCERLYDHLDRYYDCLLSLLEGLRCKDPYLGEAVANYWALGRPGFTQDYDVEVYTKLENILRLTNREMALFFDKIERVKALWEEFREECEKNKYYCEPSPVLFS